MSPEQPAKEVTLIARGGAGVTVRVLDGHGHEQASAVGDLQVTLPEGIYSVEWSSAGVRTETLVRLENSKGPLSVKFDALSATAQSGVDAPWPGADVVSQVEQRLRPSERSYGSSIAVITSRDQDADTISSDAEVRILKSSGDMLRASDRTVPQLSLTPTDSARCYRVKPGRYFLQYRSVFGETVNQTIPALPGRQTTIFLHLASSLLLVPEGESFAQVHSSGVDGSRTVIITLSGTEEDQRIRERVRLAGVLLHDLAAGSSSISDEFVKILDDEATDPLLKLYGACVVLACLEQGLPIAAEDRRGEGSGGEAQQLGWEDLAVKWLGDPRSVGVPPDVTAAYWHLKTKYRHLREQLRTREIPRGIKMPPMLDRAWTWAITRSVSHPTAVQGTASLLGAGRSAAGAAPWLCWKAAAATAAPTKTPRDLGVDDLVREVAEKTNRLIGTAGLADAPQLSSVLSADTTTTALRVAQLTGKNTQTTTASLAGDLALALKLPSTQLKRHLAEASSEIGRAIAAQGPEAQRNSRFDARDDFKDSAQYIYEEEAGSGNLQGAGEIMHLMTASDWPKSNAADRGDHPPKNIRAPGLSLRVTAPDDPQKGRFGGKTSKAGFRASATFRKKPAGWTDIFVRVEGRIGDGSEVRFYLHDSFSPPERVAKFKRGRAEIKLTAWGGFTVGIWIPERSLELELDLAEVRGAPLNIRTR